MASLGKKFDATEHNTEQRDYSNLPDGIYKLEVSASEIKTGDNGTGLNLTLDVVEPEELKGRKLFNYINIEHKNVQAQEIGQRELASLCRACGLDSIDDSEELHFVAFTAKIGMGKDSKAKKADGSPEYPAKNEIKRYYFPDQGDIPQPEVTGPPPAANDNRRQAANDNGSARSTQNSSSASSASTAGKARPWGNKK